MACTQFYMVYCTNYSTINSIQLSRTTSSSYIINFKTKKKCYFFFNLKHKSVSTRWKIIHVWTCILLESSCLKFRVYVELRRLRFRPLPYNKQSVRTGSISKLTHFVYYGCALNVRVCVYVCQVQYKARFYFNRCAICTDF